MQASEDRPPTESSGDGCKAKNCPEYGDIRAGEAMFCLQKSNDESHVSDITRTKQCVRDQCPRHEPRRPAAARGVGMRISQRRQASKRDTTQDGRHQRQCAQYQPSAPPAHRGEHGRDCQSRNGNTDACAGKVNSKQGRCMAFRAASRCSGRQPSPSDECKRPSDARYQSQHQQNSEVGRQPGRANRKSS